MAPNILLIGGNSGVGFQLARKLASEGNKVIAACRSDDQLAELDVTTQRYDAADPGATLDLPDTLDGLVYLPGTIQLKPFHRLTLEDFHRDMEVNLYGAIRTLQTAQASLKRSPRASVVLFSTVAVAAGMPFHASIASAKGAIEGLTRSLAAEWSPTIRVNAIAPSLTDTKLAANLVADEKRRDAAAARHPLKQIGKPEDTAELASFLLSPSSAFMTGQILRPDGGLSSIRLF